MNMKIVIPHTFPQVSEATVQTKGCNMEKQGTTKWERNKTETIFLIFGFKVVHITLIVTLKVKNSGINKLVTVSVIMYSIS